MIDGIAPLGRSSDPIQAQGVHRRRHGGSREASKQVDSHRLTPDEIRANLGQTVTDGKLTQSQADDIYQMIMAPLSETNYAGTTYSPYGRSSRKIGPPEIQAVAHKLGMSVGEFGSALRSGKTLADLAQEKDLSVDDLNTVAAAAAKTHLDQAVKSGRIDQSQEDAMLSNIQQGQWLSPLLGASAREA